MAFLNMAMTDYRVKALIEKLELGWQEFIALVNSSPRRNSV